MRLEFRNPQYNRHGAVDVEVNHPDLGWTHYTIPENGDAIIDLGALDGANIAPYTAPAVPIDDLRTAALGDLRDKNAAAIREFGDGESPEMMATWETKAVAADAVIAGTATDWQVTMIAAEAAGRGMTNTEMAQKIITKRAAWAFITGTLAGDYYAATAAVETATGANAITIALASFEGTITRLRTTLAGGAS